MRNLDSLGSRTPPMQRGRFDNPSTGPVSRSNPLDEDRQAGPTVKSLDGKGRVPTVGRFDSRVTSPEIQTLIPIRGAVGKSNAPAATRGSSDPYKFWLDYYRTHDETPEQLRETLRILNASGKTQDVYAVLLGYLTHHQKNRETWMYEAAAMAVEMIGKPGEVKKYLGFAADLALRSQNPNDLISVADKLYLKGYYERIGPLLDEAARKVPHRSDPLIMSINLAQQTRDPIRMRNAIRDLLSLGWPGDDDYFRQESRNQAEKLAKLLREEGRSQEADELIASLPDAEARDLFVRLTWTGDANYDLVVDEPLGASASLAMPRTVFGGALLKDGKLSQPEEVYVCPRGFDGTYQIHVLETYADPKKPANRLTLEVITHEGTAHEQKQTFALNPTQLAKPIAVKLQEGRRKSVLPFVDPLATFAPVLEAQRKMSEKAVKAKPPVHVKGAKPEGPPKPVRDSIKIEP